MMSASKASNNDICKDKDYHMPDFKALAWDIQNQAFCRVRMVTILSRPNS